MANRYAGSLFERLAGNHARRAELPAEQSLAASVAAHLTRMLGTRAGSVQTLPDYGLPDMNDMTRSLHDLSVSSRNAIESFIRKYEPRLSEVRVLSAPGHPDGPQLQFTIEGALSTDGIRHPVQFSASLGDNGKVCIRSCQAG